MVTCMGVYLIIAQIRIFVCFRLVFDDYAMGFVSYEAGMMTNGSLSDFSFK